MLRVTGYPVTVDASELSYGSFSFAVSGTASLEYSGLRVLRLLPGLHIFKPAISNPVPFRIGSTGEVTTTDPGLGYVSGVGSVLRVVGYPVTVDATALSYASFVVSGTASQPNKGPRVLWLLPGVYKFNAGGDPVPFGVSLAGQVTTGAGLGYVSGEGGTLRVTGVRVTVDATALSYGMVWLGGVAPQLNVRRDFWVLPGPQLFVAARGTPVAFGVDSAGQVSTSPDLGYVSGEGGTLRVTGVPVTIDATGMANFDYSLSSVKDWPSNAAPHRAVLLPGDYVLAFPGATIHLVFTLAANGGVRWDVKWDPYLSVRADGVLVVSGLPVTIDATAVAVSSYSLSGVANFSNTRAQQARLLPGAYTLVFPGIATHPIFTVNDDGLIEFDPRWDPYLSGRGETTLVVRSAVAGGSTSTSSTTPMTQSVMPEPSLLTSGLLLLIAVLSRSRRHRRSHVST